MSHICNTPSPEAAKIVEAARHVVRLNVETHRDKPLAAAEEHPQATAGESTSRRAGTASNE